MKKINLLLMRSSNWLFAGLLSLFGFSCDNHNVGGDDYPVEYGVPWASYAIKGKVIDKETEKAIPGIQVRIALPDSISKHYPKGVTEQWTTQTDGKGEFKLSDTPSGFDRDRGVPIEVKDIDGETNGEFQTDTAYADFKNPVHIGASDKWFQGELTDIITVKLTRKTNE